MATFSVNFMFEAEDLAEAEAIVGTWTVTPGTTITSLQGTIQPNFRPTMVGVDGNLGTAVEKARMEMINPPPPSDLPPPPPPQRMTNGGT